ncbi:MAG: hypothetical protein WDZ73_01925 [Candidatus Paceibacterota bacterium]
MIINLSIPDQIEQIVEKRMKGWGWQVARVEEKDTLILSFSFDPRLTNYAGHFLTAEIVGRRVKKLDYTNHFQRCALDIQHKFHGETKKREVEKITKEKCHGDARVD